MSEEEIRDRLEKLEDSGMGSSDYAAELYRDLARLELDAILNPTTTAGV